MKKAKIFSLILASTLCVILFGFVTSKVRAEAPSSGTIGANLTWTLENDVTLTISGSGDIPESSAFVSAPWYSQKYFIETIIIGDGITSIPEDAFNGYENLAKVTIADSVTSIGPSAFENCRKLSDIKLSANLTAIAEDTFRLCYGLTEIVIPSGVTTIGRSAFYDCSYLTSITIPSTVTTVERDGFASCSRLTDIYISDIAAWMNIKFDPMDKYHIMDQSKASKTLYLNNKAVTALVIPNGILEIAPGAFHGCNFTSVSLPNSLTKIGSFAFANCSGLTSVVIPNQVTHIESSAFASCANLTNVVIPNKVTHIGSSAFTNCQKLTGVIIGNQVRSIGDAAFSGCEKLQQITIPDSVANVGKAAFSRCSNLVKVTIGAQVTQISDRMFYQCTKLSTVVIPDNVLTIGASAFEECGELTNVTMGNGVTTIGKSAFYHCYKLNQVSFSDSIITIGESAFAGCAELTDVVFGKKLEVIEQNAFERCSNLTNVTFPDGLTTIGNHVFSLCSKYQMVVLPASIKTIGIDAFYAVWHVWFKGTESQWNGITFPGMHLGGLQQRTVHFNCTGNELTQENVPATCTKGGYTIYTCSICKQFKHTPPTKATGHSYGPWYVAKEATFASKGIERRDCKTCSEYESKDIPVKTHTDKNNDSICDVCGSKFCVKHTEQLLPGKSATCTEAGLTDGMKCSFCDAVLQLQETIPASGHHYGEWMPTNNNMEERSCDLCGEKEQRKVVGGETMPASPSSPEISNSSPHTQQGAIQTGPVSAETEGDQSKIKPIVVILIAIVVVAAIGSVTTVVIKKKKAK